MTPNEIRRRLLKGSASGLLLPLMGTGLLTPTSVLAAEWNKAAFSSKSMTDALKATGVTNAVESRDIVINAPEIAENGAKVEIEITSNLPGTRNISVFAEKNPTPLAASLQFSGDALPFTRLQLKLSESMRVRVIVKTADGKTYVAFREIKVTLGGCGG
jgi:sulfur-oxidizing protein SoxY